MALLAAMIGDEACFAPRNQARTGARMTTRIFMRAAIASAMALGLTLAALGHSAALAAKAHQTGQSVDRLETVTFR